MTTHTVQEPEWIDSAPILVSESIDIEAPPTEVWAHVADHESWPTWFEALERVEHLGSPTGVGGGRRVHLKAGALDETFTAWDDAEHFAFAVTSSSIPILRTLAESVRLTPIDGGTRVTYRQGVEGRRGAGWLMRLVWKRAAAQLPDALTALKARVEGER